MRKDNEENKERITKDEKQSHTKKMSHSERQTMGGIAIYDLEGKKKRKCPQ